MRGMIVEVGCKLGKDNEPWWQNQERERWETKIAQRSPIFVLMGDGKHLNKSCTQSDNVDAC